MQKERAQKKLQNRKEEEKEERVITLRALNMEDMRQAKNQVTNFTFFSYTIHKTTIFRLFCMYLYACLWFDAGCCEFRFRGISNERAETVEWTVWRGWLEEEAAANLFPVNY